MPQTTAITLRPAAAGEEPALRRLAALDSAPPLAGPVLLALADGEPRAALSLADGRTVADPFVPTAGLVALLRARAARRAPAGRRRPPLVARKAVRAIHA